MWCVFPGCCGIAGTGHLGRLHGRLEAWRSGASPGAGPLLDSLWRGAAGAVFRDISGGVCPPRGVTRGHKGQGGEARSLCGSPLPRSARSLGGSCCAEMLRIQPPQAPHAVSGPCRSGARGGCSEEGKPSDHKAETEQGDLGPEASSHPQKREWLEESSLEPLRAKGPGPCGLSISTCWC